VAAITPALSVAEFRAMFPEFPTGTAEDLHVTAKLSAASLNIDADVWGDRARIGGLYLAAHLLATSPFGMAARLASADGTSTYGNQYEKWVATIGAGNGLL